MEREYYGYLVVSYYIFSWLWQKWLRRNSSRIPPMFPGDLPAIGHAHLLLGNTIHFWKVLQRVTESATAKGGAVTVFLGTWPFYVLTDPEDCQLVGNVCLEKDAIYDIAKPWLGDGLFTAPVSIWRRHRKLLNPAFSQRVLDEYITVFNAQSKKLIHSLQQHVGEGTFDFGTLIESLTMETLCLTAMGTNNKDDIQIIAVYMNAANDLLHTLTQRLQTTWMLSDYLFKLSFLGKKHDELVKTLHNISNEVLRRLKAVKKIEEGIENTPNKKRLQSFLDLLLEISADNSLTDKEIREEMDTVIVAAFDASSTLMTYALVLIGSYPEVQEKMHKELQMVFEGSDRDVSKYDLPKLVYMEAVLKETLRLYPQAPVIARYLDRDLELKNYTISAGRTCLLSIYGIHTHPVWGPDRLQFRPERWLNPAELPDINTAFAGFGIGKRSCIGYKYALMLVKTTLCHILRHYRVTADCTKMVRKVEVILKPAYGHHNISIEQR